MMATRIPPAAASITLMGLGLTGAQSCSDCGKPLNVTPLGDERDAYLVTDRVPQGAQKVLGNRILCAVCAKSPQKAAERARRRRTVKSGGDYL